MHRQGTIQIRDPIHGSIAVTSKELRLIDQPAFQRLRNIKQLGFADLAFPGATHSRYSHSLGAMNIATRIFDRLFLPGDLPEPVRLQFRQIVRLAMLFHDLGHAPLSHTTEIIMPSVKKLALPKAYQSADQERRATHEDYTLKLIVDSSLSQQIIAHFGDEGVTPEKIAELIYDNLHGTGFLHNGVNYAPLLRQIVTSECDADRMDYLQRDSFFCGVNYGKFDAEWLIDNLVPVEQKGSMYLGLRSRAVFSFEDFLLSRYHMFASVYLHHTPVIFEKLLEKFIGENDTSFTLPADIEAYIQLDDVDIWHNLRLSKNQWAKRIVERKPYFLLDEYKRDKEPGAEGETDHSALLEQLEQENIPFIRTRSKSILSKYFGHGTIPLFVLTNTGQVVSLESYTPLYLRYKTPSEFHRVFVAPEDKVPATRILKAFVHERYPNGVQL